MYVIISVLIKKLLKNFFMSNLCTQIVPYDAANTHDFNRSRSGSPQSVIQIIHYGDLGEPKELEPFYENIFKGSLEKITENFLRAGDNFLKEPLKQDSIKQLKLIKENNQELYHKIAELILYMIGKSSTPKHEENPPSPGTEHMFAYQANLKIADWAKNILFGSSIKIYNLEHIYEGDTNGGVHVLTNRVKIKTQPLFKNPSNGILLGSFTNQFCQTCIKTFFPKQIQRKTQLLELFGKAIVEGTNLKARGGILVRVPLQALKENGINEATEDLYMQSFNLKKKKHMINTQYPIFKLFNFNADSSSNEFELIMWNQTTMKKELVKITVNESDLTDDKIEYESSVSCKEEEDAARLFDYYNISELVFNSPYAKIRRFRQGQNLGVKPL
jgi:hypothetical protein